MQKLSRRNTCTPTDAPQVRSNCDLSLNRDESLSVSDSKTQDNNPDVDRQSIKTEQGSRVPVLNMRGKPLMPTSPAKARKLLDQKKAKVVKRAPFVIQMLIPTGEQKQKITLGIDSGYAHIGFSAITAKKEIICGEVKLDNKTSERLTDRRVYRKLKRRRLWYRKQIYLNRGIPKDWLPPSTLRRYNTHLSLIKRLKKIFPITKIEIEVGNFDIQKINNPGICGKEYQQGNMYGYQNMRSYLVFREKGKCQICKKEFSKSQPSHLHHIIEKSKGGTDKPSNLALTHKKCHEDFHKKGLKMSPSKQFKAETFMSIIRNRFAQDLPDVGITYGYITFVKRNKLGLVKTHWNDAFVITGGTNQLRCKPTIITQKRRNNRKLQRNRKGFKPSIRRKRHAIRPKDLIWIDNKKYVVAGISGGGRQVKVENSKKLFSTSKITKVYHFGSFAH